MIIGLLSSFLFFHFGMKTLIYQTQAAGVVGRGSGRQKWDVSHFFSSYPTFLPPGHVVPDCPVMFCTGLYCTVLFCNYLYWTVVWSSASLLDALQAVAPDTFVGEVQTTVIQVMVGQLYCARTELCCNAVQSQPSATCILNIALPIRDGCNKF